MAFQLDNMVHLRHTIAMLGLFSSSVHAGKYQINIYEGGEIYCGTNNQKQVLQGSLNAGDYWCFPVGGTSFWPVETGKYCAFRANKGTTLDFFGEDLLPRENISLLNILRHHR